MSRHLIKVFIILISVAAVLLIALFVPPEVRTFIAMQIGSIQHAGTWDDDSKNWSRAFNEDQPKEVTVVHSRYWRSAHFTSEFIFYFEVQASDEWKSAFLAMHGRKLAAPVVGRNYRTENPGGDVPDWFAPDAVDRYEVWDAADTFSTGTFNSVWIDKVNGHLFFSAAQL